MESLSQMRGVGDFEDSRFSKSPRDSLGLMGFFRILGDFLDFYGLEILFPFSITSVFLLVSRWIFSRKV
jgi:hypothetical protein